MPTSEKVTFPADVRFSAGSRVLNPKEQEKLNTYAAKLASVNVEVVIMVGHAASRGSPNREMELSNARVLAVRDYLARRGVPPERLYVEPRGSERPIADNRSAEGRATNDRVELEAVGTRSGGAAENCSPCASPADGSVIAKPGNVLPWAPNNRVPVLYATNRMQTGSRTPELFYGNRQRELDDPRQNLQRGVVVVRVPPQREIGEVSRPGWTRVTLEHVSRSHLAETVGLAPIPAADPNRHFRFEGPPRELDDAAFSKMLSAALPKASRRQAVLYVHGYANDFADAAFRTAQMVRDLAQPGFELVPLMFSWPSDPGLLNANYKEAQRRAEASGHDLARFLVEVVQHSDIGTIHLVAHSMGSEVLSFALMRLGDAQLSVAQQGGSQPRFRQIVFAAPDVTPTLFRERISPAIMAQHPVTAYGTRDDLPLWFSTRINDRMRMGEAKKSVPCVDTVDLSAVASGLLRHSSWAESPRVLDDLRLLLRDGMPPAQRGLSQRRQAGGTIWALPSKPAVRPVKVSGALARSRCDW